MPAGRKSKVVKSSAEGSRKQYTVSDRKKVGISTMRFKNSVWKIQDSVVDK